MKKNVTLDFLRLKIVDSNYLILQENDIIKTCYIDCLSMLSDILVGFGTSSQCGYFLDIFEGCVVILSTVKKLIAHNNSIFMHTPNSFAHLEQNSNMRCLINLSIAHNILINSQVALKLIRLVNPNASKVVYIETCNKTIPCNLSKDGLINYDKLLSEPIINDNFFNIYNNSHVHYVELFDKWYILTTKSNNTNNTIDLDDAQRLVDSFIFTLIQQYKDIMSSDPSTPDSSTINFQSNFGHNFSGNA